MIGRITILLLVVIVCFSSCKSKKTATKYRKKHNTERVVRVNQTVKEKDTKAEEPEVVVVPVNIPYSERVANYINEYAQIAKEEMLQYGIPASITLAQGILESGAGAGELTMKANRDHSPFLTQRSRYQDLFKLRKDDYKGWAKGLRKAGYATDPKYPDKLIGIIERYNLTAYDDEVLGRRVSTIDPDDSKIGTYSVQAGDTLYSISRRFNLTVETLKKYNGLKSNDLAIGQVLYLHPVKNQ